MKAIFILNLFNYIVKFQMVVLMLCVVETHYVPSLHTLWFATVHLILLEIPMTEMLVVNQDVSNQILMLSKNINVLIKKNNKFIL